MLSVKEVESILLKVSGKKSYFSVVQFFTISFYINKNNDNDLLNQSNVIGCI